MIKLERDIRDLGGIASVAELLAREHWVESIKIALTYGRLVRVRKGWLAVPDVPDAIQAAWRVGGSLACLSAVEHHLGGGVTAPLHVLVPHNTARLRRPHDHRARLRPGDAVIYWAPTPAGGRELVVPFGVALKQAGLCRDVGTGPGGGLGRSRGIHPPAGDTL